MRLLQEALGGPYRPRVEDGVPSPLAPVVDQPSRPGNLCPLPKIPKVVAAGSLPGTPMAPTVFGPILDTTPRQTVGFTVSLLPPLPAPRSDP